MAGRCTIKPRWAADDLVVLRQQLMQLFSPCSPVRHTVLPDIHFHCPKCQHWLVVDERGSGHNVACPDCGETICIPYYNEDDTDAATNESVSDDAPGTDKHSGATCTCCGKALIVDKHDVVAQCNAAGIDLQWGSLVPTLHVGSETANGFNDIYETLVHYDSDATRAFQAIFGSYAPHERCPKCGERWCNECIIGLLPDTHLTRPPSCNCR